MSKRYRPATARGGIRPIGLIRTQRPLSRRESRELDFAMQKGYVPFEEDRFAEACAIWLPLWSRFKEVIRSRGIRGVDGLEEGPDAVYSGLQAFYNWFQDLADAVENAAAKDPAWWPTALEYSREFRELLPDSNTLHLVNMAVLEARALDGVGRHAEAESALERTAATYPDSEWAWASWGDFWSDDDMGWTGPHDREKARAIYQQGLKSTGEEPEILLERLQSLDRRPGPVFGRSPG